MQRYLIVFICVVGTSYSYGNIETSLLHKDAPTSEDIDLICEVIQKSLNTTERPIILNWLKLTN